MGVEEANRESSQYTHYKNLDYTTAVNLCGEGGADYKPLVLCVGPSPDTGLPTLGRSLLVRFHSRVPLFFFLCRL